MKIHCIAILSRQGNPLYLGNFDQQQEDVKYHYLAHTSCDVIEERMEQNKTGDLFLGLLQTVGDMVVYGYVLNTGKRIIIVSSVTADSSMARTAEIKELCQAIHGAYISLVCNPFNDIGDEDRLTCSKFDSLVSQLARTYSKPSPA
ncbi:hypothetical protein LPJ61_004245 [Coemansia biformis]|uniref:Trafficking protein particle complex subunit 2-like protein n=1 Tax=Coemansia biformis TaxID=1286918 RepID=A0A9W7YB16_9FUNG|nr:hypothetical protein LPJ61_004245 [Coemansia biformis]